MIDEQDDKPAVQAQPAVLTMTIQITRKATGKVETYELIGTPVDDPKDEQPKDE